MVETQRENKNGIWLNKETNRVLRVNSPYYWDEVAKPNWVLVTSEVNMTLLKVRETIKERGLAENADQVTWA